MGNLGDFRGVNLVGNVWVTHSAVRGAPRRSFHRRVRLPQFTAAALSSMRSFPVPRHLASKKSFSPFRRERESDASADRLRRFSDASSSWVTSGEASPAYSRHAARCPRRFHPSRPGICLPSTQHSPRARSVPEREFFIDNLLVRVHFVIVMIRWTGHAPWDFGFPFLGSLTPATRHLPPSTQHSPRARSEPACPAHPLGLGRDRCDVLNW